MKKFLFMLAVVFTASMALGQNSKEVIAKKFDTNGMGAKLALPTTDVEAAKPDVTRSQCCINFDNWTGFTLYVWVDNVFRGTLSPWDNGGICVEGGWTSYYVRTAGSTYEWSAEGECRESFTLKLNP